MFLHLRHDSFWSADPERPGHADQELVYKHIGLPVVKAAFEGFNACVLAYGQTGTGKTHTMMGADDGSAEDRGLIPRICEDLFTRADSGDDVATVEVSFYEIYKESV